MISSLVRLASAVVALTVTAGQVASAQEVDLPENLVITLERTRCFGTCPAYTVSIDAKGHVTYQGKDFVRVKERATATIPVTEVAALLVTIERIGFDDLRASYTQICRADGTACSTVTDLPTTFVSVTRAGRTKRVEDYVGAPEALRALEHDIDKAAGTRRWIWYDETTLHERFDAGWTPTVAELADLLREAVRYDDTAIAKELIDLGANPNGAPDRSSLLMEVRSAAVARVLLKAGADPSRGGQYGGTPLQVAATRVPEVTQALLEGGAPVNQRSDSSGHTPLWYAAHAGNLEVVKLLLNAGADPFLAPMDGVTVLDVARKGQQENESRRVFDVLGKPPFDRDFDGVIALVQRALAARQVRPGPR